MLVKLKTECGGAFTQRLDRMFQDVEVSRTLMERFNEVSRCSWYYNEYAQKWSELLAISEEKRDDAY